MSTTPEGWIKQIETSILQSKEIPMWGTFPTFPWKEFEKAFASLFHLEDFHIALEEAEWKKSSAILTGMGASPLQLSLELTPLPGSFSFIIPLEDFIKLSSSLIDPIAGEMTFSDPFLQKGFFRYISLETLNLLDQMEIFKGLTPKLIEMPLSKEEAYCVDISFKNKGKTAWGRLICPSLFHSSFKNHYAGEWKLSTPSHFYEEIELNLSLSPGHLSLSQEEWDSIQEDDFIFLDYCSYSPSMNRGTFQLIFDTTPLFQVKLKQERIKILDYALYYEENKMDDDNLDDESFDDESSEEETEKPLDDEDTLDNTSVDEDDLDDEIEDNEFREEPSEKTSPTEEEMSEEPMPTNKTDFEDLVSTREVPIHLSVEVARLKISLDKLLKLKPGNVLEFHVSPKQGVNLVANGKCMAKGDLVQIGDVIGVKITKIGNQ